MNKKWIVISSLALVLTMSACSRNAPAPTSSVGPSSNTGNAPATSAGPTDNAGNTPAASAGPASSAGNQGGTAVNVQTVYKQNCVTCHGVNMEGGAGPNLQKVGARLSVDQISATITNGRGGMPPFKGTLKDNEIHALSEWLAANK